MLVLPFYTLEEIILVQFRKLTCFYKYFESLDFLVNIQPIKISAVLVVDQDDKGH